MNKENIMNFFNGVRAKADKHSPEILTGIGIAGMITTTVLAVRATPKALKLIDEAKEESDLKKIEIVKVAWKPYIPVVITGGLSVACLIGASRVNFKRNAALATAYTLSEKALKDYKDSVIETVGEKKEKVIREKVAQDKINKSEINNNSEVVVVGSGDVLFLEPICGKPFRSDIEYVRKVINDFNYRMTTGVEEYISLSEFYDEFNIPHTRISDELGWNLGRDGQIEVDFLAGKTDDGKPCLVLDYTVSPRYDYSKLM